MNYLFSSPSKNSVAKRLLRPHWMLLRTRSCYRGERRTLSSTDSICMQVVSRLHTTNSNYDEPQHRQRQFYSSSSKTTTTISNNNDIPLMERSKKNFLQKMLNKYSVSEQTTRILLAESFFQAAVHQANNPLWYGPGRIPRTDFRPYQALVTMHVWFLHKRLMTCHNEHEENDPYKAALLQEELFDILWIDSSNRMRAHGVNEMLIQKNLKTVQQYTFLHMFHYDHCYTGKLLDDPRERLNELKKLIKHHILLLPSLPGENNTNDADADADGDDVKEAVLDPVEYDTILQRHKYHDDQADRIAWYVETQYQNIVHDVPEAFFEKARIVWADLPSFEHMVDDKGKELPPSPESSISPDQIKNEAVYYGVTLPSGWVRNIANDGTYYYWNLATRESQWERPTTSHF